MRFALLRKHPIKAMFEAGLSVSCSTDNRLMSGVTLSSELQAVYEQMGLAEPDQIQFMRNAAVASFMPLEMREEAMLALHG